MTSRPPRLFGHCFGSSSNCGGSWLCVTRAWQDGSVSKKPPRLIATATVDLPIVEASDVAVRTSGGRTVVLVVGDRTATVAAAPYREGANVGFGDWTTLDLSEIPGWPLGDGDSQMEAIATDGGSLVAIMSEDPPVVLIADADAKRFVAQITLIAPEGSALEWDDPSSRGEGLVLLRGGRLLVAKEKRPSALVEFSPVGNPARALSADDFLGPDEAWDAPTGAVEFMATSVWTLGHDAHAMLDDISALAVARDRSLWLLSDKSECVAQLRFDAALPPEAGTIDEFADVWRLPKSVSKPEGIAALDDSRVLVALDTGSTTANGVIVERPG